MWELVLSDGDLLVMFVLSWRVHRGDGRDDRKARDMILGAAEDWSVDIFVGFVFAFAPGVLFGLFCFLERDYSVAGDRKGIMAVCKVNTQLYK